MKLAQVLRTITEMPLVVMRKIGERKREKKRKKEKESRREKVCEGEREKERKI